MKEIRLGLKIENHDYETKRNHIHKFLSAGDKVKVTVQFRGREQTRPEMGYRMLMKLAEELADIAVVEFAPKKEGRSMTMVLGPIVKKASTKKPSSPKVAPKAANVAPAVPALEAEAPAAK